MFVYDKILSRCNSFFYVSSVDLHLKKSFHGLIVYEETMQKSTTIRVHGLDMYWAYSWLGFSVGIATYERGHHTYSAFSAKYPGYLVYANYAEYPVCALLCQGYTVLNMFSLALRETSYTVHCSVLYYLQLGAYWTGSQAHRA